MRVILTASRNERMQKSRLLATTMICLRRQQKFRKMLISKQILIEVHPKFRLMGLLVWNENGKNFKQFFVSGISKDVKDSQIASYLAKRNAIPSHISVFLSKRTGTISAKVGIPQASVSKVQEQNFWPKFVCCKPWQQKDKRRPVVLGSTINRQVRNHATYV